MLAIWSFPKIPSIAKTKVWPSVECHGVIFVWFDAEGRDPMYQLTEFDEIKKKHWTYRLDQYTSTVIWNCMQTRLL